MTDSLVQPNSLELDPQTGMVEIDIPKGSDQLVHQFFHSEFFNTILKKYFEKVLSQMPKDKSDYPDSSQVGQISIDFKSLNGEQIVQREIIREIKDHALVNRVKRNLENSLKRFASNETGIYYHQERNKVVVIFSYMAIAGAGVVVYHLRKDKFVAKELRKFQKARFKVDRTFEMGQLVLKGSIAEFDTQNDRYRFRIDEFGVQGINWGGGLNLLGTVEQNNFKMDWKGFLVYKSNPFEINLSFSPFSQDFAPRIETKNTRSQFSAFYEKNGGQDQFGVSRDFSEFGPFKSSGSLGIGKSKNVKTISGEYNIHMTRPNTQDKLDFQFEFQFADSSQWNSSFQFTYHF